MNAIEQMQVGSYTTYHLKFSGFIKGEEMAQWVTESKHALQTAPAEFMVWVDMRDLKPLPEAAQQAIVEGQKLYKAKGMLRSAVLVDKTLTKLQFERIAKETGIDAWERYFSTEEPDHLQSIERWLASATEG
jgi:hypothetical protein